MQTKQDIVAILSAAGLHPDRSLGQHFLIDGNLMRKLIESAEVTSDDVVLEVGGGTGGLSELLAETAGHLVVVEIDHDLAPILTQRFADRANVTVIHGDALKRKHTVNPQVPAALTDARARLAAATPTASPRCKLVANLPYHIATPLIMNLLIGQPALGRMCFTIQKEVADRITADAGNRDFGPLAIAVQTACAITRIAKIPAQAFWPAPRVASSMLRLDPQPHPFEGPDALAKFIDLLHAAFAHRRKTLRYNLNRFTQPAVAEALTRGLDDKVRAEQLTLETWIALGRAYLAQG
jgi:16S rRNA (adenine1518-N6/adenine1519-N6)-dimethyltransferase